MDRKFVAALSTYGEQLERIAELEQENERLRASNERLRNMGRVHHHEHTVEIDLEK